MRIRVLAGAEQDLADTVKYYDTQSAGLGREFLLEVERAFHLIESFPEAWPRFTRTSRRCLLKRFPYGIAFEIGEECILVATVMHLKRDPRRWQKIVGARLRGTRRLKNSEGKPS